MDNEINYEDLVASLCDLSEKDFKDAIRTARQFRKAQKSLMRTVSRQNREMAVAGA